MSLWDVQIDTRDGRIIAVRPEGFRHWGTGDDVEPLAIQKGISIEDTYGCTYFELDAIALEKGGDGGEKTARDLSQESVIAEIAKVSPEKLAAALPAETVESMMVAISARVQPIKLDDVVKGKVG